MQGETDYVYPLLEHVYNCVKYFSFFAVPIANRGFLKTTYVFKCNKNIMIFVMNSYHTVFALHQAYFIINIFISF